MTLLLIISISLLTAGFIQSRIQASRAEEQVELERVRAAIESFRFPLTQPVVDSVQELSGVELAVSNSTGLIQAKTTHCPEIPGSEFGQTVDGNFSLTTIELLQQFEQAPDKWKVYVFHPRRSFQSIFWEAAWTPLVLVLLVLPFAVVLSYAAAAHVTRPVALLKEQLENFGRGTIEAIPKRRTNDEIRDLSISFGEMATRLKDHESQVEQNAHLQAMVQFGASTAHHIRNAATGIKMAVQLMASRSSELAGSENYDVAIRQLALMDSHIKKFLMTSKPSTNDLQTPQPLLLSTVLDEVITLMRPMAEHLGVQLLSRCESTDLMVPMHRDDATQLMINLIGNAIDAAANPQEHSELSANVVEVQLEGNLDDYRLTVSDTGPGPPTEVREKLFKPFVTGKNEGTGLGLFVTKEIADRYRARIHWERKDNRTQFIYHKGISLE